MCIRDRPKIIAYDIAGVQPMTGPTGLIFAMRSRYTNQSGNEAFFDEPDAQFSGTDGATPPTATTEKNPALSTMQLVVEQHTQTMT